MAGGVEHQRRRRVRRMFRLIDKLEEASHTRFVGLGPFVSRRVRQPPHFSIKL